MMNFKPLKAEFKDLITPKERDAINELVTRGNTLVEVLKEPVTFDKLKKLISKYARAVSEREQLLNEVIERTIKIKPSISVGVNEIIQHTQELINALKKAGVVEQYAPKLQQQLKSFLAKHKVFVKFDKSIKYLMGKTRVKRHSIILGFDDLNITKLVKLLLNEQKKQLIDSFLITEEDLIESGVINEFLKKLSHESLRLALRKDPNHENFLLKIYVTLEAQANKIRDLKDLINQQKPNNPNELSACKTLIKTELKKVTNDLITAMDLLKMARSEGLSAEHLISRHVESELVRDAEDILKSYLRLNYELDDLLNQLTYEFLVTYGAVPIELEEYNEFKKRARYLLLKELF